MTTFTSTLSMEPYQPRVTGPLGVVEHDGWSVKLIGISADGAPITGAELDAAVDVARRRLPQPARDDARCGVGFVIVHRGDEALWVLVCWWELDIMYEQTYYADLGATDLQPVGPDGPTACVWELLAVDHERRAWVEHVLAHPTAPDFAAYLASSLVVSSPGGRPG